MYYTDLCKACNFLCKIGMFNSSVMWLYVVEHVAPDVWEGSSVVVSFDAEDEGTTISVNFCEPLTQRHTVTSRKTWVLSYLSLKLVNKFCGLFGAQTWAKHRKGRLSEKGSEMWTSSHNLKPDPIKEEGEEAQLSKKSVGDEARPRYRSETPFVSEWLLQDEASGDRLLTLIKLGD